MENCHKKTELLPKKTRAERQQELQRFLQIRDGLEYLAHVYRSAEVFPGETQPPAGPVMIREILDREFPAIEA